MNKYCTAGRFASDPKRANFKNKSGVEVSRCFFVIMKNNGKKPDGTEAEPTKIPFSATGKIADVIMQYKHQGDLVAIEGEYAPYLKTPVDMDNKPIENARKVWTPMFDMTDITFLMNSRGNGQNQTHTAENHTPDASANQQGFNQDPMLQSDNVGDVPFDMMEGDDPFHLTELP